MGKRGRTRKAKNTGPNKDVMSSPQPVNEKITKYCQKTPEATMKGSSAMKVHGAQPEKDIPIPANAGKHTDLPPSLLTPENTPTKASSAPLQEDPSLEDTLPYPLDGLSAATGDLQTVDSVNAAAADSEGALAESSPDVRHAKMSTKAPVQPHKSGDSKVNGVSRSLKDRLDAAASSVKSKKSRGKKSAKAGTKTSNMKSPAVQQSKKESLMKTMKDFFPVRRSDRRCKSAVEAEKKVEMEEAILSNREVGLEVKEIIGKGRGVVSTRAFRRGDFVVEYHGDLIDIGHAKDREEKYKADPSVGCYMYYFEHRNRKYCIDATKESGRLGRLLNHSRNGNCCTKLIDIGDRPYLILVARQHIKAGEELLYDYGDRNRETLHSHPWLAL